MAILKTCSFQILSATMAGEATHTFQRVAHKADFDHVERRPGYLYVRSRAISSRINENFDGFSAEEIKKGYQSFMGKPVFVSHHNENHRRARGAIVAVALHEDYLPDKSPDTWVEVLMEVDAINFPKLAQAIVAGEVARTSMGCFVPGTPITLADGTKKPIEDIVVGDEVLTHTGQIEPVTYVMEREYRGTTYEVHSYGQSAPMVLTEEHPVWVERNGTPQWVEASQLSTDDWVLTPALQGIGKPGEAPFARLLGLYLAEGNFGYDRKRHGDTPTFVEWNYHVEETEFIEETIALLQELGYSPVGPYIKNNCATVRVNSAELAERFLHHGGKHSWAKKMSIEVMNWEPEVQKLVVTGWLDGDGCYRKNRVEVGTASEDLAHQMYALGLRTGIPFTPPTKQHSPSAQKLGKRPKWVLQSVLFPSIRGDDFSSWGRRMSEEGQWRKITHLESHDYQGLVYNFDVEGDDSYVASDIAVHNCDVEYSRCTFCNNKAYTEAEYCSHIPRLKGKKIRRVDAKTGASSMVLVAEECFGLNFFENSLLVEEPADPTAYVLGIDGQGVHVTASKTAGVQTYPESPIGTHLRQEHGWSGDTWEETPEELLEEHRLEYPDCAYATAGSPTFPDVWDYPHNASKSFPPGFILTADEEEKRYHDTMLKAAKLRLRKKADHAKWCTCKQCGYGWSKEASVDKCPNCGDKVEPRRSFGRKRVAKLHRAINETIAPPEVDTLRESECPICGSDAYNGEECPVCFAPDTLIRTEVGYLPIASIEVGDRVLSSDGRFHRVEGIMERDFDGIAYELRTKSMTQPIIVTPEHPIYALVADHGNAKGPCRVARCRKHGTELEVKSGPNQGAITHKLDFLPVRELSPDSRIGTNALRDAIDLAWIDVPNEYLGIGGDGRTALRKGPTRFELTEDFLWAVGLYLAEGSSGKRSIAFSLHEKEIEYIERLDDLFSRMGYTVTVRRNQGLGVQVDIYSTTLAQWFPHWLGHGSENKSVPSELMNLPLAKLNHVMQGIWDGDGGRRFGDIGQTSREIAMQMAEWSLRRGLTPTQALSRRTNKKDVYTTRGLFHEINQSWSLEGRQLSQIASIREVPYAGKVYNLQIEGDDPTYTVENIVVHNCNFIKPPDMFMDPDLEAAQNADLRQDERAGDLQASDQIMDSQDSTPVIGDALAGIPLQCDNCGTSIDQSSGPMNAQGPSGTASPAVPGNPADPTAAPGAAPGGAGAPPQEQAQTPGSPPKPPAQGPAQPATQPGSEPPPPANDESMPLPTGKGDKDSVPPAGKELPKPRDGENDDGQDDGSVDQTGQDPSAKAPSTPPSSDGTSNTDKGSADKSTQGKPGDSGKVEHDIDAGGKDGTKPDDGSGAQPTTDQAVDTLQTKLKPGDPCPVCDGKGKLQPKQDDSKDDSKVEGQDATDDGTDPNADPTDDSKDPSKGDSSDDSAPDDKDDKKKKSDGPPWLKDKNSSKGVKSSNQSRPGVSNMAQPTVKVLASQQAEIRRLKAENARLTRSVNYIAALIGITADENDPANPVPQPAGGAPSQTSEEVMNSATRVDVQQIGATPVNGVGADATTTVDQVGGINADTPYQINTEVTTPVAGTETRIPVDKVRTLPEIQFGNPNNPDTAFPLEGGPFAEKATLGSKGRTYAALRLARLRRAAGIETSGRDELVVADEIDRNASLSDQALGNEIETLSAVVSARKAPAPRQAARRLVPQSTAGVERTVPSVAVSESLPKFTSAAASDDDAFAFCE